MGQLSLTTPLEGKINIHLIKQCFLEENKDKINAVFDKYMSLIPDKQYLKDFRDISAECFEGTNDQKYIFKSLFHHIVHSLYEIAKSINMYQKSNMPFASGSEDKSGVNKLFNKNYIENLLKILNQMIKIGKSKNIQLLKEILCEISEGSSFPIVIQIMELIHVLLFTWGYTLSEKTEKYLTGEDWNEEMGMKWIMPSNLYHKFSQSFYSLCRRRYKLLQMILHLYKIFEEEFPNPMICILTNRVTKNVKNLFLSIYHMGFKNSTFLSQYKIKELLKLSSVSMSVVLAGISEENLVISPDIPVEENPVVEEVKEVIDEKGKRGFTGIMNEYLAIKAKYMKFGDNTMTSTNIYSQLLCSEEINVGDVVIAIRDSIQALLKTLNELTEKQITHNAEQHLHYVVKQIYFLLSLMKVNKSWMNIKSLPAPIFSECFGSICSLIYHIKDSPDNSSYFVALTQILLHFTESRSICAYLNAHYVYFRKNFDLSAFVVKNSTGGTYFEFYINFMCGVFNKMNSRIANIGVLFGTVFCNLAAFGHHIGGESCRKLIGLIYKVSEYKRIKGYGISALQYLSLLFQGIELLIRNNPEALLEELFLHSWLEEKFKLLKTTKNIDTLLKELESLEFSIPPNSPIETLATLMKQEHENTYPKTQIILSESSFDGKNVVISFDLSENKGISGEEDVSKCFAECGLDLIYSEINASIRPRYIKWNNSVRGYNKSLGQFMKWISVVSLLPFAPLHTPKRENIGDSLNKWISTQITKFLLVEYNNQLIVY